LISKLYMLDFPMRQRLVSQHRPECETITGF
jgi:hypothetical protein